MFIAEWAVGLVLVIILLNLCKFEVSGIFALIILTIVPWGIGAFIFKLAGIK